MTLSTELERLSSIRPENSSCGRNRIPRSTGVHRRTMSVSKPKQYALAILASIHQGASAFTSPSATSGLTSRPGLSVPAAGRSSPPATTTSLASTVDPSTITKKEYQDICGVDFDDTTLADRLARTNYLYPKHVEVIEDFAPLVDKMVDEIVSISAGKGPVVERSESRRKKGARRGTHERKDSSRKKRSEFEECAARFRAQVPQNSSGRRGVQSRTGQSRRARAVRAETQQSSPQRWERSRDSRALARHPCKHGFVRASGLTASVNGLAAADRGKGWSPG